LGHSHFDIFPDIPDHWKQLLRRCLTGETIQAQEERWDREDGSILWLRWEIRPWGSRDGLPEGVLIFSENITDRKLAESTLRDNEQPLRVLAGSLLTAQDDERRRLPRELHDDVTQRLALLSIDLGKLAGEVPDSLAQARTTIRALQDQPFKRRSKFADSRTDCTRR
jgi:signal transduction histidine kinase